MSKVKTFFEQVPLALALQVAQRDGSGHSGPVLCGICATPVELEHCKTNEFGKAVHEKCYAAQVAVGELSSRPSPVMFRKRERAKATNP